ncbi:hypothetical protein F383_32155 [Gossypium arboreum]|uniref:Uncharacterized protein n=1 Tax=Gossypium arboreum TaxID=29729 RepID=A0A0B0N2U8_GOSAR|nr:hypothetical protein F383_32155 [Gossypium arboreum]
MFPPLFSRQRNPQLHSSHATVISNRHGTKVPFLFQLQRRRKCSIGALVKMCMAWRNGDRDVKASSVARLRHA